VIDSRFEKLRFSKKYEYTLRLFQTGFRAKGITRQYMRLTEPSIPLILRTFHCSHPVCVCVICYVSFLRL